MRSDRYQRGVSDRRLRGIELREGCMSNVVDIRTRQALAAVRPVEDLNARRLDGLASLEQRHQEAVARETSLADDARMVAQDFERLARRIGTAAAHEVVQSVVRRLTREGVW